MSKMFLLYSFILSLASEKVDLSETTVSSLLSGEIGAMVVDHVALLSCPDFLFIVNSISVIMIILIIKLVLSSKSTAFQSS